MVPLAIRGARSMLRANQWFPRRGAVRLTIGAPLTPQGTDWAAARRLQKAARAHILRYWGEPDLEAVVSMATSGTSDS